MRLTSNVFRLSSSVALNVVMLSAGFPFRDTKTSVYSPLRFGFRALQKFRRFAREFRRSIRDVLREALRSPELAGSPPPIAVAGQDIVGPRGAWPVAASVITQVGRGRGYFSSLILLSILRLWREVLKEFMNGAIQ